jgi:hypothetical protein
MNYDLTGESQQTKDFVKEKILSEYEKGNIVIATVEGLQVTKLDDLINQHVK